MTDPAPLLPTSGAAEAEPLPPLTEEKPYQPSLDDTIERFIGDFGWKNIFQATLVCFACFFDAQQTFISVFTDAEPGWICINANQSSSCNPCQIPGDAWSWVSPPFTSIISEWSLLCAASIIKGLPASSFFFGCLIGGFALSTLADSELGRKNLLVISSLVMSITGVMTAFSTNVWLYTVLRFVSGFGRATIGTCSLVLSTELVGRKWRQKMGIMGFVCFTMGFLSLPAIAFSLKGHSWRLIYIWTSVPSLFYSFLVFFLVRESPRWLFIKGRKQEFAETLGSMAATTSRSNLITQSFFGRCPGWEEKTQETNIFSALKILHERVWSCQRLVAVTTLGFGMGMIYYGMPLGLGNLSFDLYMSVTLNALSEFPASLLTFVLIEKLNRKHTVFGLSLLSGICSVSCAFVRSRGLQVVLELASFFCACMAFDFVMIYTLELFPTCVRNSAVSMARQALVFSGALSPVLVAAGRKNGLLSYGVFGVTISMCALCVARLPETKGRVLCDTIEEEERREAALNGFCA